MRNPIAGVRRDRTAAVLLAAGMVVGCVAGVALAYRVAVRTVAGRVLDGHALRGAVASRSAVTDYVQGVLDVVSVASLFGAAALIAVIALVRLRRAVGLAALVVLVGANVTSQLLKNLLLHRPDLGLTERTPATLNSFPSGHSTVAFSVVAALLVVLPGRLRPVLAVAGAAYATVTAAATMSAGWHRPSDSVAAFLVVGAWVAAVALAVLLVEDRSTVADRRTEAERRTARRLLVAGGLLLAAGAVLAAVAELVGLRPGGTFVDGTAYLAGLLVLAGTAALVVAGVLVLAPGLTFTPADPALPPDLAAPPDPAEPDDSAEHDT